VASLIMRIKGRTRKILKAVAAPANELRPGYRCYCDWTLYLSCGHTVTRRSTIYAKWKWTDCNVLGCEGDKMTGLNIIEEAMIDRGWMPVNDLWKDPITGNLYPLNEAQTIIWNREK
jgi:hypothetical protein